jgi:hypothetical protein
MKARAEHGSSALSARRKAVALFVCAAVLFTGLLSGCRSMSARAQVKEEPVAFTHPDEIIKGNGPAEGYRVLADRRVFAVMAFLNAVGDDDEVPGQAMHPLRLKVRRLVAENLARQPNELRAWKRYYAARRLASWQYANFALSLSADYPFRRIRPDKELAYAWTASMLAGFPVVLNEFWKTARLDTVWTECRSDYLAELSRYSVQRMADEMESLWRYLKMRRTDHYVMVQVPNPLQRHATATGNTFGDCFYSVDGPGASDGGLNVHEYLHTVVNPIMEAGYAKQAKKLRKYFDAGRNAAVSASYQEPVNWATECLVHALVHRFTAQRVKDPALKTRVEGQVDALTRGGYFLLKPLYICLADFEETDLPFDQYLPTLLRRVPEYSAP